MKATRNPEKKGSAGMLGTKPAWKGFRGEMRTEAVCVNSIFEELSYKRKR